MPCVNTRYDQIILLQSRHQIFLTDMKQIPSGTFPTILFKDYQNVLIYIFIVLNFNNYQRHDITFDAQVIRSQMMSIGFFSSQSILRYHCWNLNAKDFVTFLVGVSERIGRDLASGSFL